MGSVFLLAIGWPSIVRWKRFTQPILNLQHSYTIWIRHVRYLHIRPLPPHCVSTKGKCAFVSASRSHRTNSSRRHLPCYKHDSNCHVTSKVDYNYVCLACLLRTPHPEPSTPRVRSPVIYARWHRTHTSRPPGESRFNNFAASAAASSLSRGYTQYCAAYDFPYYYQENHEPVLAT